MYWLYLILFILAVLTPKVIQADFAFIAQETAETLAILLLGTMGFLLFLWQERKSILHWKQRNEARRSINQISKDLVESYSYIGEINRKIEILQGVISALPEHLNENDRREYDTLSGILHSMKTLVGSDQFAVYFCNLETHRAERIFKLNNEVPLPAKPEMLCNAHRSIDQSRVLVVDIPHEIRGLKATLVAVKKKNYTSEDITIIKALVSLMMVYYLAVHPHSSSESKI